MSAKEPNLCLYFRQQPEKDRFLPADRFIRPVIRRILRGKKVGGVEKVFINLCKGLDAIGEGYSVNKPFPKLKADDRVVVLGSGAYSLEGYSQRNKIVAGIGLMTHPSEWPKLLEQYPVAKYLQHSDWANNVYIPYYGSHVCETWFAGIETEKWKPIDSEKPIDILLYNKIRWEEDSLNKCLLEPVKKRLQKQNLKFKEIKYGDYKERDYHRLLNQSKAMIFLCEHESQGFACCEALSMNVPVFAWENGFCLDPNRFKWNAPVIPATSVPFFDGRCGERFKSLEDFEANFDRFQRNVQSGSYNPRSYITENLTLEKSAEKMLSIINSVY